MEITDTTAVTAADVAAVRALAARVAAADGVSAFDEQTLLNLDGGRPVRHLVVRATPDDGAGSGRSAAAPLAEVGSAPLTPDDGEGSVRSAAAPLAVVGYAQLADASAELAVEPSARGAGAGAALLDAVLAARADVRVWAHGNLPAARALAARRDLRVVRDLWVMSAPAPTGTGATPAVAGVRVRPFEPGRDEDAWLSVNARAFAGHPEQGRITRADLDARMAQPWFDPAVFWLAEDVNTGRTLGSMWVKISEAIGEIYVLGVDPSAQGRGIGGLLTAHAMAAFAARDLAGLELYVEGENAPAIAVYERAGFRRTAEHVQYARPGSH